MNSLYTRYLIYVSSIILPNIVTFKIIFFYPEQADHGENFKIQRIPADNS